MAMNSLNRAAEVILRGGVVAVPTETVYGLVADALNPKAVEKIYQLKKRPPTKPLALFVRSLEEAEKYAHFTSKSRELGKKLWPGPLTLVLKATEQAPEPLVTPRGTIGIRIPDDEVVMAILEMTGKPLASTSANVSGMAPARTSDEVRAQLGEAVDFIIMGVAGGADPSTVLDMSSHEPVVLRKGPISIIKIENIISSEVKLGKDIDLSILFVCTGNLYRSQIARAVLEDLLPDEIRHRVTVDSAGIAAVRGMPIPSDVVKALGEIGIRIGDRRSKPVDKELLRRSDIIYVMEREQFRKIRELGFGDRTMMFSYDDIPDPVGRGYPFIKLVVEGIKYIVESRILPYILRKF